MFQYAGILILMFVAQVVLGVLAFLAIRNGNLELKKEVENHLTKIYDQISQKEQLDIVNALQRNVSYKFVTKKILSDFLHRIRY